MVAPWHAGHPALGSFDEPFLLIFTGGPLESVLSRDRGPIRTHEVKASDPAHCLHAAGIAAVYRDIAGDAL
jgi:hypothetical protein